jgi:hypothetical protein
MYNKLTIKTTLHLVLILSLGWLLSCAQTIGTGTPVTESYIAEINNLFEQNGIYNGFVVRDERGRVELAGGL